jgi:hypothetical protein
MYPQMETLRWMIFGGFTARNWIFWCARLWAYSLRPNPDRKFELFKEQIGGRKGIKRRTSCDRRRRSGETKGC